MPLLSWKNTLKKSAHTPLKENKQKNKQKTWEFPSVV